MPAIAVKKEKKQYGLLENLRFLLANMWRWDKGLFLFFLFQIPLTVLGPFLKVYLPKVLIDSIASSVGLKQFITNIGVIIMAIILSETLLKATALRAANAGVKYRFKYLNIQAEKVIDTDYENIDGPQGQQKMMKALMATMNDRAGTQAITTVFTNLLSNIMGMILYGGIIFTIHPVMIGFIILSSLINYYTGDHANKYEHRNKDNLAPVEKKLKYIRTKAGDFRAAKDLRLYNMGSWFKDMYNVFLKEKVRLEKQNIYRKYLANITDGILGFIRDGMAYGFLIYSVLYRDMPVGNFVLYLGVIGGFSNWMTGIIKNINEINRIHLETCDLREFLDMEDKMNRGKGVELPAEDELPCDIEIKNLYYRYPGASDYALKNINLHVKKGEKLAIVGVNGAGKSTLVKLIAGLYTPTDGEIYVNGKKSSSYNRDEYYTLFSVVFQDIHLLPMSIEENITLQPEKEIDRDRLDKVLELSGLMDKIKSLPEGVKTPLVKTILENAVELSGGELQKLLLARALYKDAPIIILDEPTAALDPIAEFEIYSRFNEIVGNKTTVYISHRLSSCRFCDEIAVFHEGRIVQKGTHEELLRDKEGKYYELWHAQAQYYNEEITA